MPPPPVRAPPLLAIRPCPRSSTMTARSMCHLFSATPIVCAPTVSASTPRPCQPRSTPPHAVCHLRASSPPPVRALSFWNQAKMTSKQEPWTRLAHSKKLPGWVAYNPRTMRPAPLSGDTKQMKILSWNVNGLRNIVQLGGFSAVPLAQRENFDVLCLQETHLKEGDVKDFKNLIAGYEYSYWSCSVARLDYSGTGVISRVKPITVQYGIGIAEHDQEGRVITLEFENFYLVNAYVPNSGCGLRRLMKNQSNASSLNIPCLNT